jgi:TPP-dependent pyruvate/acetoin dehydrogenase alpha subunit
MNQGAVHEGLNLAAVLALPLVVVVENNGWSEMSRITDMITIEHLCDRASAYGIPGEAVDGNDPARVAEAMAKAVTRARGGGGPTLIEATTERLVGHYSGDAQHYRPADEVARARQHEPLVRMRAEHPESQNEFDSIDREIAAEIDAAVASASELPFPDPTTARNHVYA